MTEQQERATRNVVNTVAAEIAAWEAKLTGVRSEARRNWIQMQIAKLEATRREYMVQLEAR